MKIKDYEAELQRLSDAQRAVLSEAFSNPERQEGLLRASRSIEREQGKIYGRIDEEMQTIHLVDDALCWGIVIVKERYVVAA